jgi:tRNA threonylcarbamoyladenosine biosynthesis protein TsaB
MLLGVDTSSRWMGVALYDGSQVLSETVWCSPNYHTAQLAPVVAQALDRVGCPVADLKAIGVAIGPGGFTGLRVGLAFAKGLALASRLPLIGIPTLDALVSAQKDNGTGKDSFNIVAVLQAGRGRLAIGWYNIEKGKIERGRDYEILTVDVLAERLLQENSSLKGDSPSTLVCGELGGHERRVLEERIKSDAAPKMIIASPASSLRRPGYLAELAWQRWQAGKVDDAALLTPIYLH